MYITVCFRRSEIKSGSKKPRGRGRGRGIGRGIVQEDARGVSNSDNSPGSTGLMVDISTTEEQVDISQTNHQTATEYATHGATHGATEDDVMKEYNLVKTYGSLHLFQFEIIVNLTIFRMFR